MIIAGIAITVALAFIGATMIYDGKNPMTRICGVVVVVMAGVVLGFSLPLPGSLGYVQLDHEKCAQYVWMNGEQWVCVPWTEAE